MQIVCFINVIRSSSNQSLYFMYGIEFSYRPVQYLNVN